MFKNTGPQLWELKQDFRILGSNLGACMNIVETANGLLVHSPVGLTKAVGDSIKSIGTPRFIIAPNLFHHLHVNDYLANFSNCKLYTAPGLIKRRPDLKDAEVIEDNKEYLWSDEIDHFVFRGGRMFIEVIFYHKKSKTLILTDFAFNIHDTGSWFSNLLLKASGSLGQFGQTFLEKLLIRDRQALKDAYEKIMQWDFQRISVTHGLQVETNAKEVFKKGIEKELRL
jgi:hypothetical protein